MGFVQFQRGCWITDKIQVLSEAGGVRFHLHGEAQYMLAWRRARRQMQQMMSQHNIAAISIGAGMADAIAHAGRRRDRLDGGLRPSG